MSSKENVQAYSSEGKKGCVCRSRSYPKKENRGDYMKTGKREFNMAWVKSEVDRKGFE